MIEVHFAVPGDLAQPTGGYAYARALLAGFPAAGVDAKLVALPGTYPFPTADDLAETERLFLAVPKTGTLLIDGLAFGAMPVDLVAALPQRIVALVHHPLALESGLDPAIAVRLRQSETAALAHADRVVVTSPTTARELVASFEVPADKIAVALPGVARARRSSGGSGPGIRLLALGAVSPRKGYDVLVAALASCRDLDWQLDIVGSTGRMPDVATALEDDIARLGLGDRITLAGAVDDAVLDATFMAADAFVMSSRYEGYGMVLTEALSRGLAIVTTTGGAAAETAPDDAALKVPPGDAAALAQALRQVIGNAKLRRSLSDAAWRHAGQLPRWSDTVETIAGVLKEVT